MHDLKGICTEHVKWPLISLMPGIFRSGKLNQITTKDLAVWWHKISFTCVAWLLLWTGSWN